jgi:serine protease AprX
MNISVRGLPLEAKPKIAADTPTTGTVQVIIVYQSAVTGANQAAVLAKGGSVRNVLNSVKGAVYTVDASALNAIAADPAVLHISPDRKMTGALEFANPTVNANIARQYGFDGTGIGIALIDSGVSDHPDLHTLKGTKGPPTRVVYSQSFVPGSTTDDNYGHGTHVAGILAGNGAN